MSEQTHATIMIFLVGALVMVAAHCYYGPTSLALAVVGGVAIVYEVFFHEYPDDEEAADDGGPDEGTDA